MKTLRTIALALAAVFLVGCNSSSRLSDSPARARIGQECAVQFRRDALGAAAPNGIQATVDSMNGSIMNLYGTLTKADNNWVVLLVDRHEYVIPTHAILLIDFPLPPGK